ncbi:hypothetical protein L5515_019715 [Caenorhabditis briggsae]|uniref:Uncharacterized protein n=1 Tax=Caenorhabditis briggsae TaxID=6238 RepID=A0AAE9FJW4_CAEBR|nr:hypothetical protein L5515_019715 [Caenorhabditis briggsae]
MVAVLVLSFRTAEDFDGESLGFFGSMDNNNETTMKSIVIHHWPDSFHRFLDTIMNRTTDISIVRGTDH